MPKMIAELDSIQMYKNSPNHVHIALSMPGDDNTNDVQANIAINKNKIDATGLDLGKRYLITIEEIQDKSPQQPQQQAQPIL